MEKKSSQMLEIAELVNFYDFMITFAHLILSCMAPVSIVSIEQFFAGDKKLMARKAFLCC